MNNLHNYRKIYCKDRLEEENIDPNPMMQFRKWFYEAEESGKVEEVNAMGVSTIGVDGFPKTRVVLLKHYDENGFVFYTNYNSEKGKAIAENPNVCLSFFWPSAERQMIIKGIAEKILEIQSDNYFDSRPMGSKIGAIVSPQSQVITSIEELLEQQQQLEKQSSNTDIKRPKHWGGFLVRPVSMEFWQGRPNRLHDRIRYTLTKDFDWKIERLAP